MVGLREMGAGDDVAAQIAQELMDPKHTIHIENLLDAIVAIYHDCDLPMLKRNRNVEMFLNKYEPVVKRLIKYRMKDSDFQMIKVIGRGAYGEVQLVRHNRTKKVHAMKRLEKSEMIRRYDSVFVWEEREIMLHANSKWIVQMHYAFQDPRYLYMVMEFMPGGDLVNLFSREQISEEWARFYVAELVLALEAIHEFGYIHRDVKPDNMLISRSGHVKLADFGSCLKLDQNGKVKCGTVAGTPDYICPEVLVSQCAETVYGVEVDFWSVGITLYELIFGDPPFYAETLVNTYQRIQNYSTELKFPDDTPCSSQAKEIIKSFLSGSTVRLGRNGASEVRTHPFFVNGEWTFDTIRDAKPPFIPQLTSDDDTSNFEDISPPENNPADGFHIPKMFNGNQLSFIGFTYSGEFSAATTLRKMLNDVSTPIDPKPISNGILADPIVEEEKQKRVFEMEKRHLEEKQRLTEELNSAKDDFSSIKQLFNEERILLEGKIMKSDNLLVEAKRKIEELDKQLLSEKQTNVRSKESYEEDSRSLQSLLSQKEEQLEHLRQELNNQSALLAAERREQAERLREQQGSRISNVVEEKIAQLGQEVEKHRQSENTARAELWSLQEEKTRLSNGMLAVQREKAQSEERLGIMKEEYSAAQKLIQMYKSMVEDKDADLAEKNRENASLKGALSAQQDNAEKLRSEHIARKIAEQNAAALDREKSMLHAELLDKQREIDTLTQAARQNQENMRMTHGTRSNSGPMNASLNRSSDSFSHHGSSTSLELESLSRDQLIGMCRREKAMKESLIQKLLVLGSAKGIESNANGAGKPNKKLRNELARQKQMWEREHGEELRRYRQNAYDMENEIETLRAQVADDGDRIRFLEAKVHSQNAPSNEHVIRRKRTMRK